MATRKSFIAGVAVAGAATVVAKAGAQSTLPVPPKPVSSPKPPSALARALAERMRAFDPSLTDDQIETIADGIEGNLGLGMALNPNGTKLKNSDEPTAYFEVTA